jgi:3',5'-cyclic AMP phosphodiesterase CpdA
VKRVFVRFLAVPLLFFSAFAQRPSIVYSTFKKASQDVCFAHLTDTHIGEGALQSDYGTKGFYDTLTGAETGYPATRLSSAISWLNQHAGEKKIKFVIFSGDLTDSGEKSEFLHFKKIADALSIPYVPLIGNHDVWSYNFFGNEDTHARGDSLMNEIFRPTFENLKDNFEVIMDQRHHRWYDEESKQYCYLQNFALAKDGIHFIFLDFNPRYHVRKPEPGIGPEAQLHPGEGGTLSFLQMALQQVRSAKSKAFIISHHPPVWSLVGLRHAFSAKEKSELARILKPYARHILGWLAGHIHRNAVYHFSKANMIKVVETKSSKAQKNGCFRIIQLKK